MKIGKFRIRRKAVSPVIATLLIVAIAVAAAIITYVWSMGLLGGLMGTGGQQTKEQLIVEFYDWKDLATIKFSLRNVGSVNCLIAAVYLEGEDLTAGGDTISIGTNKGYTKTVTGTFTYSVICGRAG